jgi:hypothetical protein
LRWSRWSRWSSQWNGGSQAIGDDGGSLSRSLSRSLGENEDGESTSGRVDIDLLDNGNGSNNLSDHGGLGGLGSGGGSSSGSDGGSDGGSGIGSNGSGDDLSLVQFVMLGMMVLAMSVLVPGQKE